MASAPRLLLAACAVLAATVVRAAPPTHPQAEAQALALAERAIALRSVRGPGNETPKVAALFRDALIAGGFSPADITITPLDDTAYLIARWGGSDPALNPLVISGHMDVVEARRADWTRDPFTPVVENGYLYGRGATDMKLDDALAVASLIELRREGWRPRRDIVLALSGDEETTMASSAVIASKLAGADFALNLDEPCGALDETTGRPAYFAWIAAEKTYADFELTVTNPGGHSSEPRADNAIVQLAAALVRIGAYHFKPELSDLTRASLTAQAARADPAIAAAMRAFVADPTDRAATAVLAANPPTAGQIATTCVPTLISGGHAANALPQRASATVNCRIFPGHAPSEIMAELARVAAEPAVHFADITTGNAPPATAMPVRADVVAAVKTAIARSYPGLPVFPTLAVGATDSMWYRAKGVPSYVAGSLFIKPSEDMSHGLDERTPVFNIGPSIDYYLSLIPDLSK